LNREPEFLLHSTNLILCFYSCGTDLFALKYTFDVGINSSPSVHLGELLSLDKSDFQLFELLLDLGWHEYGITGIRSTLIVELNLLISWALNRYTDLKITGDI